jgi:hypothetical protein
MVLQATPVEAAVATTAALELLNGPRAGEVMALEKRRTALGKPGVQVAVILHTPDGYELLPVALATIELTIRVNGERLQGEPRLLQDGDEIAIADARLRFIAQR